MPNITVWVKHRQYIWLQENHKDNISAGVQQALDAFMLLNQLKETEENASRPM